MAEASIPSVLALIPARGGSKRIPGKNIKSLCGLPLIAHTLQVAREAGCFQRVLVSTDDPAIAEVAREYGGEVPWLRSALNADDTSTAVDAILEVLDRIEGEGDPLPEAVMLLQPTSPFRSVATIRRAYDLYGRSGGESVVSVSPAASHPWWCKTVAEDGALLPFLPGIDGNLRSQDLPPAYALNGVVYMSSVANLRTRRSLYSPHTRALVIEAREEAIDLDTPFDWAVAEAMCQALRQEVP